MLILIMDVNHQSIIKIILTAVNLCFKFQNCKDEENNFYLLFRGSYEQSLHNNLT